MLYISLSNIFRLPASSQQLSESLPADRHMDAAFSCRSSTRIRGVPFSCGVNRRDVASFKVFSHTSTNRHIYHLKFTRIDRRVCLDNPPPQPPFQPERANVSYRSSLCSHGVASRSVGIISASAEANMDMVTLSE